MKLIIQIPCLNEAESLPGTLSELPRTVEGFNSVEWLIVDDGSTDATAEIAAKCGVHHIIRHSHNLGLARAFMTGLHAALERGADVIVNTDADNQYKAADIPALIAPILSGEADLVIGQRPIESNHQFSFLKKKLQRIGSLMVRWISKTSVQDSPSGFRALSRKTALQINVFNPFTYTIEMIIQAGRKGFTIKNVPIRVNRVHRPSRLFRSLPSYITRSTLVMIRMFIVYNPLRFFGFLGFLLIMAGTLLGMRFLISFATGHGEGMLQSLILSAILVLMGTHAVAMGILADLLSVNRQVLEDIQYRIRRKDTGNHEDGVSLDQ